VFHERNLYVYQQTLKILITNTFDLTDLNLKITNKIFLFSLLPSRFTKETFMYTNKY